MILVSLFIASNLFIPNNYKTNIQLLRISMHVKYFSNSYVICTSHNNDTDNKSRKRKFNEYSEFKEKKLIALPDIKNNKIEDLSCFSSLFIKSEVYSENFNKNNKQEQVHVENEINGFYNDIIEYLEKNKRIHNNIILRYFKKLIRNYELIKNKINKKEFITKIEEILKKIIEKSFLNKYYNCENYSSLFQKIYESSSKALNIETGSDKIRNLYELLLDIKIEDNFSKDKKDMIINFKYILLNTKDYKEMEVNIKKKLKKMKYILLILDL